MPNKTIYVAEDDLPLFEQALELGDNLSATIAKALRMYVEAERAKREGFEEITVRVGHHGHRRFKRFRGYRLARWVTTTADERRMEIFSVFKTRGGRFAVHRKKSPNWALWADPENWPDEFTRRQGGRWRECAGWRHDVWPSVEATLEVYETLEELRHHVPPELFELVKEASNEPPLEELDI
ncbi:MAG: EXLDI protein [Alicyclobacillaceae bacterium]|nr:EXLDI protein [Alicyclobacillaceae bacterium]